MADYPFRVLRTIMQDPWLGSDEKLVHSAIMERCVRSGRPSGRCLCTVEDIASDTGLASTAVRTAIRRLKDEGRLARKKASETRALWLSVAEMPPECRGVG